MREFLLLISFDGMDRRVRQTARDVHEALDIIRLNNPDETVCLVRRLD